MGLKEAGLRGSLRNVSVGGSPIPDSGVARWTFDDADTSGSTAVDVWNGNDGSINGATTGVSGANQTYTTNEAYSFNGTDNVVTTSSVSGVGANQECTLGAWFKNSSTVSSQTILEHGNDGGSGNRVSIGFSQDNADVLLAHKFDGSHTAYGDTSFTQTGSWVHLVGVFDPNAGQTVRCYINGSEVTEPGTFVNTGGSGISIGANSTPSAYFSGDVDDPRIYDKALTSTEVSDWYNNGSI